MLESIFKDNPYLICFFITKNKIKTFVNKFFDQTSTFSQANEMIFFLLYKVIIKIVNLRFFSAKLFLISVLYINSRFDYDFTVMI